MRLLTTLNAATEPLDPIEKLGRDSFHLNLMEWLKFRHVIYVGNDSSKLLPRSVSTVTPELAVEYQTLAKSHYQSVSRLVCARACLDIIMSGHTPEPESFLTYFRAQPEFYLHLGGCLDGIARLAFLLCTHGQKQRKKMADWWDYAKLRDWDNKADSYVFKPEFKQIGHLVNKYEIEEVYLIRNGVAHGWQIPGYESRGRVYWPEEIKTRRFLAWPYIERGEFMQYTWKHTIQETVTKHFRNAEAFFGDAFSYFRSKVPDWEQRNGVEIATR